MVGKGALQPGIVRGESQSRKERLVTEQRLVLPELGLYYLVPKPLLSSPVSIWENAYYSLLFPV